MLLLAPSESRRPVLHAGCTSSPCVHSGSQPILPLRQCQDQEAVKWTLVQCFQPEPNFGSGKPLQHARVHGTGGPWACWESISPTALPRVQAAGKGFKDSPKNTLGSILDIRQATLKKEKKDVDAIVSYREHLMPRFLGVAAAEASTSRSISASSCGRWPPVARILNVRPSEEANLKQLAPGGFRVDRMKTIAHTLHRSQSYHAFADGARLGVYSDNVTHPAYRPYS